MFKALNCCQLVHRSSPLGLERFDDLAVQKELSVSDLTKDDVAGHIAKPCYYDFWKTKLNALEDVLESLIHGYKIPLFRQPPECELPHNASARDPENAAFLDKDIRNLLAIKAIYKVKKKP